MAINLRGYVYDSVGAANSVTVEVWEHDGVAASATTTTDGNGLWSHASLDATKQWKVKIIDGTKVQWIDGRSKIQLTELDLITSISVDTIAEHTAASGVTIDGLVIKDSQLTIGDDLLLKLGTDADIAFMLRSTILNADTALTGVLEGTVEAQAIAANSLMIANQTNDGDIAFYVSKGGNSQMVFWADGSTGDTAILAASGQSFDVYIAGTKEIDYATATLTFQQATVVKSVGALTLETTGSGADVLIQANTTGGGCNVVVFGQAADDFIIQGSANVTDGALLDSGTLVLRGWFDSDATAGITAASRDVRMQHDMQTAGASPKSTFRTLVAAVEGLAIENNNGTVAFSVLGATPSAQKTHVADPSGGGTQDAEARSAINSILVTLESFGFHATS